MSEFDLSSAAFFAEPSEMLRRLREHDPVHFHAPLDAFVLTRYADVAHVIRQPGFSVDRGGAISRSPHAEVREALDACNRFFGRFMVFADPPVHTRLRASVAGAFTPARMRVLAAEIERIADALIDTMCAAEGPVDLVTSFAEPLPTRVTARLLGLPDDSHLALERITDDFFAFFGAGAADVDTVLRTHAAIEASRALFDEVVEDKLARPGDDILSALITEEARAQTLSRDELLGVCITLVAGAYGTTSHLIANAVHALLSGERSWSALVADPGLAGACVEETLRYDGPALAVVRRAMDDTHIAGIAIPKDARIYAMLHAANHDPEVFGAPARFDISRSANRHLGLGAGAHFCLGASLTRLEASRALAKLTTRCPHMALEGPSVRAGNLSMRGFSRVGVRVSPEVD